MDLARISAEQIKARLDLARNQPLENPYPPAILKGPPRPAAVLLPFLRHQGLWHLLFIRRTVNENDYHAGQVAFPGGRSEQDDPNPEATALREAEEEIGLHPEDVRILGRLNENLTISNYLVTPVVGVIPWPYPLQPAPDEVSRVFTITLAWLADPANHEVRYRPLPPPNPAIPVIYFKPYEGEVLWGASARITLRLLQALGLQ